VAATGVGARHLRAHCNEGGKEHRQSVQWRHFRRQPKPTTKAGDECMAAIHAAQQLAYPPGNGAQLNAAGASGGPGGDPGKAKGAGTTSCQFLRLQPPL